MKKITLLFSFSLLLSFFILVILMLNHKIIHYNIISASTSKPLTIFIKICQC